MKSKVKSQSSEITFKNNRDNEIGQRYWGNELRSNKAQKN